MLNVNRQSRTVIAILACALVVLAYQTFANRPPGQGPIKPAIIAAFDLEKTFNSIDQKKAADAVLKGMAEDMRVRSDEQSKLIKQMQDDLKDLQPNTTKFRELSDKIAQQTMEYRAYIEFCKAKVDSERAKTMKRIYLDIRKAVADLARANHYSIVFVDDSVSDIPQAGEDETNRQISARRMAYTDPEIDITDLLIFQLNSAFKANGGVIPPLAQVPASNSGPQPAGAPTGTTPAPKNP